MNAFREILTGAVTITALTFLMMVVVDYVDVLTRGRLKGAIRGGGFRQYVVTSFLGVTPGCLGGFINVSFYMRGLITFGALVGGMAATCGDESFVMLAMFPGRAFLLFAILFVVGVGVAFAADRLLPRLKIKSCGMCGHMMVHEESECRYSNVKHYIKSHIWGHLIKRHIWRIFLWSIGALLVTHIGLEYMDIEGFVQGHMMWVLLIAVVVGLIPESGPHLIFVVMFAKGVIPFSVLVASSISQSGHGVLPLLSHSVKDSILLKIINMLVGLAVGFLMYMAGG